MTMLRSGPRPAGPANPVEPDGGPDAATLELRLPWWAMPMVPVVLLALGVAWWTLRAPDSYFAVWEVNRVFGPEHMRLQVVGVAALVLGFVVVAGRDGLVRHWTVRIPAGAARALQRLELWLALLVIAAYVIWVGSAVLGGATVDHVAAVLAGEPGSVTALKRVARPITGLTTFTQFAPVAVTLSVLLWRIGRSRRRWVIPAMLLLALGRALLYAERLALIELAVPVVLLLALTVPAHRRGRRIAIGLLPVAAVPALWGLFAVFESTRSWTSHADGGRGTFTEYVTARLLGYYGTAVNNSAVYHDAVVDRTHLMFYPVEGIWDMPVVGSLARVLLGDPSFGGVSVPDWWMGLMEQQNNPEFVNTGTFVVVAGDVGVAGLVLCCAALGMFLGVVVRRMVRGGPVALIVFVVSYVGLLEIIRLPYFGQGRFLVTLLGCLLVALVLRRAAGSSEVRR